MRYASPTAWLDEAINTGRPQVEWSPFADDCMINVREIVVPSSTPAPTLFVVRDLVRGSVLKESALSVVLTIVSICEHHRFLIGLHCEWWQEWDRFMASCKTRPLDLRPCFPASGEWPPPNLYVRAPVLGGYRS